MKGYLNRPDETDKYFDDKGFGHMGDLVYYDDFGNVFFVERIKEMLKYSQNYILIHEAKHVSTYYTCSHHSFQTGCPSIRPKTSKSKASITAGREDGVAEWIIYDSVLLIDKLTYLISVC